MAKTKENVVLYDWDQFRAALYLQWPLACPTWDDKYEPEASSQGSKFPTKPDEKYGKNWEELGKDKLHKAWKAGRDMFLSEGIRGKTYFTFKWFLVFAQKVGSSSSEYAANYHSVDGLPKNPETVYKGDWENWTAVYPKVGYYSFEEAKALAQAGNFACQKDYQISALVRNDDRLPKNAWDVYKDESDFDSHSEFWRDFLGY